MAAGKPSSSAATQRSPCSSVNSGITFNLKALTVENGNTSGNGGGLYNDGGTVNVTDSTFSGNTAFEWRWHLHQWSRMNVTDSTVSMETVHNRQINLLIPPNGERRRHLQYSVR